MLYFLLLNNQFNHSFRSGTKNKIQNFFVKNRYFQKIIYFYCFRQMCILPGQTHNGYSVLWARLIDYDSSKFFLDDAIKLLFMVVDACLARDRTSAKGMIIVFDNKGNSLSHLARVSLASTKKYFIYVQVSFLLLHLTILLSRINYSIE